MIVVPLYYDTLLISVMMILITLSGGERGCQCMCFVGFYGTNCEHRYDNGNQCLNETRTIYYESPYEDILVPFQPLRIMHGFTNTGNLIIIYQSS